MKTKFTFLIVLVTAFCTLRAQGPEITNGGFDTWTNYYTTQNWATIDAVVGTPVGLTFEDTLDFVQGTASIKLVVDTVSLAGGMVVPGLASLGTGVFTGQGINFAGVPFIFRPDTLFFAYKYTSPGPDTAAVVINLAKAGSGIIGSIYGIEVPLDTTSAWQFAYVELTPLYLNNSVPDTLNLQFMSSIANNSVIGSTLHVDAVSFSYKTILNETASASGSTAICPGDSAVISANTNNAYQYQWYMNGFNNPIAGANGSSYAAKDTGTYFAIIDSAGTPGVTNPVTVTQNSNCTPPNGIVNIAPGVYLNVYPNPASNVLNVTSDKDLSGFNMQVYDLVGRMVSSQSLEGISNAINVSKLANGTYIYRITDKQGASVTQNKFNVIK